MAAGRTLEQWLSWQHSLHPRSIDLGLERVRAVADRLALLPPAGRVALVGGTNGKGSTSALLAALARAHGARTGLFTSPHLLRYHERIHVDGAEPDDAQLCAAFERIEAARGGESLTYFEFNTLAALLLFRAAALEVTVLEVGLGGRLDATNIVDADVSVLCSVGLDHRDWLGDSLEQIGAEKAGIFRAGRVAILGDAAMPSSVGAALARLGVEPLVAGRHFTWQVHEDGSWDYRAGDVALASLPPPALQGRIQYRNAAVALRAYTGLRAPQPLQAAAVATALRSVRLPGRMQFVPGPIEWVFDVAHNEAAAAVLAAELRSRPPRGRTLAVFGMLEDKDVGAVAAQLDGLVDEWLLCTPDGARALDATRLRERMGRVRGSTGTAGDVAAACARAAQLARPGDRVLVCGSFHTVGPALRARRLY